MDCRGIVRELQANIRYQILSIKYLAAALRSFLFPPHYAYATLVLTMKSSILNVVGDFFALDIGSSAIRVAQLRGGGGHKTLVQYGAVPIDVKTALSDAAADQVKIAQTVKALIAEAGIATRNVVVGLPSSKTFVTVVDLPKMSPQELGSTIKYQADQFIPMSADEAKIDWAVLGDSPVDPNKIEVLLASVSNKFSEQRMDVLESIGLNVIALEPDALALARSLTSSDSAQPAQLIVDIGEYATDLVITVGGVPRLVRSIPTGGQTFVKTAAQHLSVEDNQANQFMYKFGLDQTKLEGQVYRALEPAVATVVAEIEKSIKFFNTRYQNVQLNLVVASGVAAILPGMTQYLAAKSGLATAQIGNSWQNVSYGNAVHEQLMSVNHQFAVAVGLALREAA